MRLNEVHDALRAGRKARRKGWNGKGMFLFQAKRGSAESSTHHVVMDSFVVICTSPDRYMPWLCSQGDWTANDWEVFD